MFFTQSGQTEDPKIWTKDKGQRTKKQMSKRQAINYFFFLPFMKQINGILLTKLF
jgi:hypothetical protein